MDYGTEVLKAYVQLMLASDRAQEKEQTYYRATNFIGDDLIEPTADEQLHSEKLAAASNTADLQLDSMRQMLKGWGRKRYPNLEKFVNKNW